MSQPEHPNNNSRINRRCVALVNIAKQGELAASGLDNILSKSPDRYTREELAEGLTFAHYLELDLQAFADGEEYRAGLESCNRAAVMKEVFGLTDPRKDAELMEKIRSDLKSATEVLTRWAEGQTTDLDLSELASMFLKSTSAGYERAADKATEKGLISNNTQIPEKKPPDLAPLDTTLQDLRTKFHRSSGGTGIDWKPKSIFVI